MKTSKFFFILFLLIPPTLLFGDIINVPADTSTIQGGIFLANEGDTVLVAEGTYYENINFQGKAITVASMFIVNEDTSHISKTIISGSQPSHSDSGSVVYFISGEDTTSVLCGFTITDGTGTLNPSNPPALPAPYRGGGGIFCFMSGAYIKNNIIIGNECIINLPNGFAAGGGIVTAPPGYNSFILLENNKIIENLAWSQGSATGFNDSWAQGGGISIFTNGLVEKNEIKLNQCKSNNGLGVGGGIRLFGGTVDIIDNIIVQNNSVSITNFGLAGGISCSGANTFIDANLICDNSVSGASECYGAAIYFDLVDTYYAIVKNNYIAHNFYANGVCYGGGIGMYRSKDLKIYNNIVIDNKATYGGAFHSFENSEPVIINNTIINNIASQKGGALFSNDASTTTIIINTIMWENIATVSSNEIDLENSGKVSIYFSDIQGDKVWDGKGNINVNPGFADSLFNLSDSSACIGNGIDSIEIDTKWIKCPTTDYFGNKRPHLVDDFVDIGAIESSFPRVPLFISQNDLRSPYIFELDQNYPNPFNPSTTIEFTLPKSEFTTLKVYNILGKEVSILVSKKLNLGNHAYQFDGKNLATGIYYYQLVAGDYREVKKMILIK